MSSLIISAYQKNANIDNTISINHSTNKWITKLKNISKFIQLCAARRVQRRRLARLSEHNLNDMGISRTEALLEAKKPSWR